MISFNKDITKDSERNDSKLLKLVVINYIEIIGSSRIIIYNAKVNIQFLLFKYLCLIIFARVCYIGSMKGIRMKKIKQLKSSEKIKSNKKISEEFFEILSNEKNEIEKINLIKIFSNFYWSNIVGKYRDNTLEKELFNIGKNSYQNENTNFKIQNTLHIITETYLVGGHTRLLSNWIKFDVDVTPDVVIVNPENSKIPNWLIENIKEKNGNLHLIKNKDISLKVQEMTKIIKNYSEIILHIHPNDVTTCLALANLNEKQKVYFVNHADHVFSLGYNYSNCVLELSEDGKKMGQKKREIKYSEVLPIPIDEELNYNFFDNKNNLKQKIVISMASEYKYLPTEKYNFQDFVDKLLNSNKDIIFNLVGASEKNKIWKDLKTKYKERFNLLGVLPKEKAREELLKSKIYIDSFPFASYTSLLQAIDLGLIAYSLKTEVADLDSLKSIKVDTIDLLVEKVNQSLLKNDVQENLFVKNKVKEYHYKEAWQKKLKEIRNKSFDKKNILEKDTDYYNDDYERLFLSNAKKRFFKFSYREFLKLKLKNKFKILLLNFKG
ncbi:MAG: hypothetical protein ACRC0G_03855 [Fusobacteriaceae bacterium]